MIKQICKFREFNLQWTLYNCGHFCGISSLGKSDGKLEITSVKEQTDVGRYGTQNGSFCIVQSTIWNQSWIVVEWNLQAWYLVTLELVQEKQNWHVNQMIKPWTIDRKIYTEALTPNDITMLSTRSANIAEVILFRGTWKGLDDASTYAACRRRKNWTANENKLVLNSNAITSWP